MIDIIIPVFNQWEVTVNCLKSIKLHTKNYRIIWVDNKSDRKSRRFISEELENHNHKKIWLDKNYGFVKAVNVGIKASTTEYLVLLNNDTAVTPNWLERLKMPFKSDKVAATGPFTDTDGSWQGWRNVKSKRTLSIPVPDLEGLDDNEICAKLKKVYKDEYYHVGMIAFFCTLFKRSIFDEVGLLDERFGLGLGDDDAVCHKIIYNAKKKVVFVPSAFCHHYHRTTFKSMFKKDKLQKLQDKNIQKFINLRDNDLL